MTQSSRPARDGGSPDRGAAPADQPGLPRTGGRAAARRGGRRGRRRTLKIVGLAVGFVVLVGAAGVAYAWHELGANVKSDDLFAGSTGSAGKEKPDAFGRTPINILMIGSDARADAADCKLGGACSAGSGERADVEMVVHISADRSNATVMSIPRDLVTSLPGCVDNDNHTSVGPRTAPINSALNWSPGCSVAAVQHLTGIPIDHFMMVDFSGVVKMSDAIGGVSVCVDHNVYDPYSHLKLSEGGHTLKGVAALEFLRTRHGFGTGDDPGRTVAQHLFLTSMINKLKSEGTFTDPAKIWSLADAATRSLTVDTALRPIKSLLGLADDVNKVPTNRITFVTMQNVETGPRTVAGPNAGALFKTIADDQSLTTGSGAKSSAASAASSGVPVAGIAVDVRNGTGLGGRAGAIAGELTGRGFSRNTTAGNGADAATTTLTYPAGQREQAEQVAKALGLPAKSLVQGAGSRPVLLIGADWASGTVFPGGKAAPTPVNTTEALGDANAHNGADNNKCAQVGDQSTIGTTEDGRITTAPTQWGTTPRHAYDISPGVKNSAP